MAAPEPTATADPIPTTPEELRALSDEAFLAFIEQADAGTIPVGDLPDDAWEDFRRAAWAREYSRIIRQRRAARERAEEEGLLIAAPAGNADLSVSVPDWYRPGRPEGWISSVDRVATDPDTGEPVDLFGEPVPERSGNPLEPFKTRARDVARFVASRER